jgi:hypothetical protein
MLLDSQTFELQLTPEVAIGLVQKELARSGYKAVDIQQIRLFYTPFWVFTFDVEGTPQPISGKTALNASSGDVNEFVPILLERPLNKTRRTDEKAGSEVEPTAVDSREVEKVATARVAAQLGVKKDQVSVSAFQKIYVPFYRVWMAAEGNPVKAEVDGCLGATFGLEGVPKKAKSMDQVTKETLDKMKTPSGWVELGGKTAEALVGAATGKGGPLPGGQSTVYAILILAIMALLFLMLPSKAPVDVSCSLGQPYYRTATSFLFFKSQVVTPASSANGTKYVEGTCTFKSKSKKDEWVNIPVYVRFDGNDNIRRIPQDPVVHVVPETSTLPLSRQFRIEWEEGTTALPGTRHTYEFVFKP